MADPELYDGNGSSKIKVKVEPWKFPTAKPDIYNPNYDGDVEAVKQYAASKLIEQQKAKMAAMAPATEIPAAQPAAAPELKWDKASLSIGKPLYLDTKTLTVTGLDTGTKLYVDEKGQLTENEAATPAIFNKNLEILASGNMPDMSKISWQDYLHPDEPLFYDAETHKITNTASPQNYQLYLRTENPGVAGGGSVPEASAKYLSLVNTGTQAKYSAELRKEIDDALGNLTSEKVMPQFKKATGEDIQAARSVESIQYKTPWWDIGHFFPSGVMWDDLQAFFGFNKTSSVDVLHQEDKQAGPVAIADKESSAFSNQITNWSQQVFQNFLSAGSVTGNKAEIVTAKMGVAVMNMFKDEKGDWSQAKIGAMGAGPIGAMGVLASNVYQGITSSIDQLQSDVPLTEQMGVTAENAPQMFNQAAEMHNTAFTKSQQGDMSGAISDLVNAYKIESAVGSLTTWMEPYYSYTFIEKPEKYQEFLENRAYAELQMGRLLNRTETRSLMEASLDADVEMRAGMIFDATTLLGVIPAAKAPAFVGKVLEKVPLAGKIAKSMITAEILGTKAMTEAEKLEQFGKIVGKTVTSIEEAKDAMKTVKLPAEMYQKAVNLAMGLKDGAHFVPFMNQNVGDLPMNALMSFTQMVWSAPFKAGNAAAKALKLDTALSAFVRSGPVQFLSLMTKNAFTSSGLKAKSRASTVLTEVLKWSKSYTSGDSMGLVTKALNDLEQMAKQIKAGTLTLEEAQLKYAGYGKRLVNAAADLGNYTDEIAKDGTKLPAWGDLFQKVLQRSMGDVQSTYAEAMLIKKAEEIAKFTDEAGVSTGIEGIRLKYGLEGSDDEVFKQFVNIASGEKAQTSLFSTTNHLLIGNYFADEIERQYLWSKRIKSSSGRMLNIYKDSLVGLLLNEPNKEATDITRFGLGLSKNATITAIAEGINTIGSNITNLWIRAVLSRWPSWLVNNVIESTFRFVFYGGYGSLSNFADLFDNLEPVIRELEGFPLDFLSSFADSVKSKRITARDLNIGSLSLPGKFMTNMREAYALRRSFLGMLLETHFGLKAWEDAMRQTNQIFEAGLRLRMFNKFFQQNKARINATAFAKVMGNLKVEDLIAKGFSAEEATQLVDFASKIWQQVGNDPQLLRSITKNNLQFITQLAQTSLWVPKGIYGSALADTITTKDELLRPFIMDLSSFMQNMKDTKGLDKVTPTDIRSFFDAMRMQVQLSTVAQNPTNISRLLKNLGINAADDLIDPEAQDLLDVIRKSVTPGEVVPIEKSQEALATAKAILGKDAEAKSPKEILKMLQEYIEGKIPDVETVTKDTIHERDTVLKATEQKVQSLGDELATQAKYLISQVARASDKAAAMSVEEIDAQQTLIASLLQTVVNGVSYELSSMTDLNLVASGVFSAEIKAQGPEALNDAWNYYRYLRNQVSVSALQYMNEAVRRVKAGQLEPFMSGSILSTIFDISDIDNKIGVPRLILNNGATQMTYYTKDSLVYQTLKSAIDLKWPSSRLGLPAIGKAGLDDTITALTGVSGARIKAAIESYGVAHPETLEKLIAQAGIDAKDAQAVNQQILREFGVPGAVYVDRATVELTDLPADYIETVIRMFTDEKPVIGPLSSQNSETLFRAAKEMNKFMQAVTIDDLSLADETTVEKFMRRVLFAQYGSSPREADQVIELLSAVNKQFETEHTTNWLWKEALGEFRSNFGISWIPTDPINGVPAANFIDGVRGMTQFTGERIDGASRVYRTIVTATSKADATTALHEIFHSIVGGMEGKTFLPSQAQRDLDTWAVNKLKALGMVADSVNPNDVRLDQKLFTMVSELQATAWERYLYEIKDDTGSTLPTNIRRIFNNVSEIVRKIYQNIKSWVAFGNVEVTAEDMVETRKVFDSLFGATSGARKVEPYLDIPVPTLEQFPKADGTLGKIPDSIQNLFTHSGFDNQSQSLSRLYSLWNWDPVWFSSHFDNLTSQIIQTVGNRGVDDPVVTSLLEVYRIVDGRERMTNLVNDLLNGVVVDNPLVHYKLRKADRADVELVTGLINQYKQGAPVVTQVKSAGLDYAVSLLRYNGYIKLTTDKPNFARFVDDTLVAAIDAMEKSGVELPKWVNLNKFRAQLDEYRALVATMTLGPDVDYKALSVLDNKVQKLVQAVQQAYTQSMQTLNSGLYQVKRETKAAMEEAQAMYTVLSNPVAGLEVTGVIDNLGDVLSVMDENGFIVDTLTGFKEIYVENKKAVKVVIDLDNFDLVANSVDNQESIDNYIRTFAKVVQNHVGDDPVYRVGSTKFIAEFPDHDVARVFANALVADDQALWAPVKVGGKVKEAFIPFAYGISQDLVSAEDEIKEVSMKLSLDQLFRDPKDISTGMLNELNATANMVNIEAPKYRDVNTGAFRRWFGDGIFKDEQGRPKVWYHATRKGGFSEFKYGDGGFHVGELHQAEKKVAGGYNPGRFPDGSVVLPVYINVSNPIRLSDPGIWTNSNIARELKYVGRKDLAQQIIDEDFRLEMTSEMDFLDMFGETPVASEIAASDIYDQTNPAFISRLNTNDELLLSSLGDYFTTLQEKKRGIVDAALRSAGFDGVIYENKFEGAGDSVMVFNPTQIKSIFNGGNWDPGNPDILYQRGRDIADKAVDLLGVDNDPFGSRMILDSGDMLDLRLHQHHILSMVYDDTINEDDYSSIYRFMHDTRAIYWSTFGNNAAIVVPDVLSQDQEMALLQNIASLYNLDQNATVAISSRELQFTGKYTDEINSYHPKYHSGVVNAGDVLEQWDEIKTKLNQANRETQAAGLYQRARVKPDMGLLDQAKQVLGSSDTIQSRSAWLGPDGSVINVDDHLRAADATGLPTRGAFGKATSSIRWFGDKGTKVAYVEFLQPDITPEQLSLITGQVQYYPEIMFEFNGSGKYVKNTTPQKVGEAIAELLEAPATVQFDNAMYKKAMAPVKSFGGGSTSNSPRMKAYKQTEEAFWEAFLASDYGGNPLRRILSALLDQQVDLYDREAVLKGLQDVVDGHRMMAEGPVPNIDENTLADTVESLMKQIDYASQYAEHVIIKKDKWMPAPFVMDRTGNVIAEQAMNRNLYMATSAQEMVKGLNEFEAHVQDVVSGQKYGNINVSGAGADVLEGWAKSAADELDKVLFASTNGGVYEGTFLDNALGLTNHIMLDYTDYSRLDQIMRSIIPFWMYPSRTMPFWVETFARNPELVAAYHTYQTYSHRKVKESGATTSNGEAVNSLQGYIPIPGTQLWFNPTAPLAFRYAFPYDYTNAFNEANDEGMLESMMRMLYEQSSIRGFGMSPVAYLAFSNLMSGKENIPHPTMLYEAGRLFFPLELVPPFAQRWIMSNVRKFGFSTAPELWDPEVSWKDFMIERQILQDALGRINKTASESEKLRIAQTAQSAIKSADRESNPLWVTARDQLEASEYWRKIGSRLTGFFTKEYDTDLAELYKLRDDINLMKDMINNNLGAALFDMSLDSTERYRKFLDKRYDTPEGFLWNDYQKIRFVTDPTTGLPVDDPEMRRKLIEQAYASDEATVAYYDKLDLLQKELNERFSLLPIGAASELRYKYLDQYFTERAQLEQNTAFDVAHRSWMAGLKPDSELADHYRYLWWQIIRETSPHFDPNVETYTHYKERLTVWKAGLPALADREMPIFMATLGMDQKAINAWNKDIGTDWTNYSRVPQDLTKLPSTLVRETNAKGYDEFMKQNDTVYEALEKAWDALVLDPYFVATADLGSAEKELYDQQWKENFKGLSVDELIKQIKKDYGAKFADADIRAAYNGRKINTPQEALATTTTETEKKAESIWTMLNWASANGQTKQLRTTFKVMGGEDSVWDTWYVTKGNPDALRDKERFNKFYMDMTTAAQTIDLQRPTTAKLIEVAEAQRLDREFIKIENDLLGPRIQDIISTRSSMTFASDIKQWAMSNPADADLYSKDKALKDEYAVDHQVWAKYYNPKKYHGA